MSKTKNQRLAEERAAKGETVPTPAIRVGGRRAGARSTLLAVAALAMLGNR